MSDHLSNAFAETLMMVGLQELCIEAVRFQGTLLALTPPEDATSAVLRCVQFLLSFSETLSQIFPSTEQVEQAVKDAIKMDSAIINRKLQPAFYSLWRNTDLNCIQDFLDHPTHADVAMAPMPIRGFAVRPFPT